MAEAASLIENPPSHFGGTRQVRIFGTKGARERGDEGGRTRASTLARTAPDESRYEKKNLKKSKKIVCKIGPSHKRLLTKTDLPAAVGSSLNPPLFPVWEGTSLTPKGLKKRCDTHRVLRENAQVLSNRTSW